MNLNLFKKELKRNRKNFMIWTGIAVGFTIMIISLYPSFKDMGIEMGKAIPKEMAKAFNMDMSSWQEVSGYYKTYFGFHIIIILSIFACSFGASIVSKEEKDRTSEFLLTKPISRKAIFLTKVLALMSYITLSFLAQTTILVLMIFAVVSNDVNWNHIIEMHINGYVLCLFFGAAGLFLSQMVKGVKNYMGPVVGIVMGTYFLHAIGSAIEDANWISKCSPFHYLGVDEFSALSILIVVVLALIFLYTSFKIFKQKDIGA